MLEKYKKEVKLVDKHFPLPNHSYARKAAIAALAADRQGKYWEFSERLFANQNSLSDAKIQEFAKELKLNVAKFNKDMQDPKIAAMVDQDTEEAMQANVRGIPTVFVNGKQVANPGMAEIEKAINGVLKK